MEHLSTTPLSSAKIKTWTDSDRTLSQVRQWVLEGWPDQEPNLESGGELLSYSRKRLELGVEEGCVLRELSGGGA